MGYLYKIITEEDLSFIKEGNISLSRPIFEFSGSEGWFIGFTCKIYKRFLKEGANIEPKIGELNEIRKWIDAFKSTYLDPIDDLDLITDACVIFCGIIQGYCGYFTKNNLFEKETLKNFLIKNRLENKKYVLKLDDLVFENNHWKTYDLNSPFVSTHGEKESLEGYNGFTHPTDIVYSKDFKDYKELLKIYNKDEVRHASAWFNNLSKKFEWQNEKRIIFSLESLDINSRTSGVHEHNNFDKKITKCEEKIFYDLVSTLKYSQKGPQYLYLNVGLKNMEIRKIEDVIN